MDITLKTMIISITMMVLLSATAGAAGGFGEYASLNACHCLLFNSTSATHQWVLVNSYSNPLTFNIIKPNISNVLITASVSNGIIDANSIYIINITVVSHSKVNETGDIIAVATPIQNASAETIQIGTEKLLEIQANGSLGSAGTSTITNPNITSSGSESNKAGTSGKPYAASSDAYIVAAIIVVLIIAGAAVYYKTSKRQSPKGRSRRRRSRR